MVWVPKVTRNTMLTVQPGQKALLWTNVCPASRTKSWASCAEPWGTGAPRLWCTLPSCWRLPTRPLLLGPQGSSAVLHSRSGCGTAGASKSAVQGVGALLSTFTFAPQQAWDEQWPCGAKGMPEATSYSCCWGRGLWPCKDCRRQKPLGWVWGGETGEQQRTTPGAKLSC